MRRGESLQSLNFDTCRLGHPLEDVVKFIDFAFFNSGPSQASFALANAFLAAYRGRSLVSPSELNRAARHYARQVALTCGLEEMLVDGFASVSQLIRRDLDKLRMCRLNAWPLTHLLSGC